MLVQTDEQKEAEIERRTQDRVAAAVQSIPNELEKSVERAMRNVLSDVSLREQFWEQGYRELEKHAGSNAAQWLGRRLWNIVLTAAIAAAIAWVVMTGRLNHMKAGLFAQALWRGKAEREEVENREAVEKVIDFLEIQAIRKTPVGRLPYGLNTNGGSRVRSTYPVIKTVRRMLSCYQQLFLVRPRFFVLSIHNFLSIINA